MLTGSMIEKFTQRISVLNHKAKSQELTPSKQNHPQYNLLEQQHSQRDEEFQKAEKQNKNIEKQSEEQKIQQNDEEQDQSVIQNSSEESDKKFIQKFTDKLNQPSQQRKDLLQKIKSRIALIKPKIDELNHAKKQEKQTKYTEKSNKLPIKRRGRPPRQKSSEQPIKTKKNTQNQQSNQQNVEQVDAKQPQNVKQYKQSQRREAVAQIINQIKLLNNEEKNNHLKKKYRQFGFLSSHQLKILVDSYKMIFAIQKQIQGLSEKPNEKQTSRRFARQFLRYVQQNPTAKKYKFRKICTYVLRGLNLNNFRPDVWLNKFMTQNKSALKGVDLSQYSQKKTSLSKDKQPYEKVMREMDKRKSKELEIEQQKKQEKEVKKSKNQKIQKDQKNELKRLKKPVKIEINSSQESEKQKSEKQSDGSVYTKKSKKSKRIIEKKMEKEKQRNLQKQKEQNMRLLERKEIEKQKQREKQKQIQKQIQKEIEKEKQKQKIKQRELQKELEKQKEKNREKEKEIQKQRKLNSKAKKNAVQKPSTPPEYNKQLQNPKIQVKKQFTYPDQLNKQDPSSSRVSKLYPQNFRKKIASKLDSAVLDFFQNLIKNKSQQFCVEEDTLKQIYEEYAQFNRNGSRIENNSTFLGAYTVPQQYEINSNPEINEQKNEEKVYQPQINLQYENNVQEQVFQTDNIEADTINSKLILNVEQKVEPNKNSQNMNNFSINTTYNKKPKQNSNNGSISQRNPYNANININPPIIQIKQRQKVNDIKGKTVNPFEIIGGRLMNFLRHNSACTERMIKDQAIRIVTNAPDMLGKIKEQSLARWLHTFIQRNKDKIRQSKTPNQTNHQNTNPKIAQRAKIMIKPPMSITPPMANQPSNVYRPFQQPQSEQKPQYSMNSIMQNGHTSNGYENSRSFQIAVPRTPPRTDMKGGYIPQNGRI